MKKFVILDGNALVHRSFHAVPPTLTTPAGEPINAVYGFTSILLGIFEIERPDFLVATFDLKGPTFRHTDYAEYKGTRPKTDVSLVAQFPLVKKVLGAFSVPIFEQTGLEADDFLGILSAEVTRDWPDVSVLLVTGDKDAMQLVSERVTLVTPVSGYTRIIKYDRAGVHEKMGVWPEQVPDFKALCGDPSDNIPGVHGIGPKGACELLAQFGSLEEVYSRLNEVASERVRGLLAASRDQAFLYKRLATILTELPSAGAHEANRLVSMEAAEVKNFDMTAVRGIFAEFGFRSLLGRIEKLYKGWSGADGGDDSARAQGGVPHRQGGAGGHEEIRGPVQGSLF
ncbi:MAG: 5'-3' exonuclease H3TH domain-containing protein [Candidatus Gracilibacteria bacterium]|jgi:DNA polymerase-1